jgi:hypothetical protein
MKISKLFISAAATAVLFAGYADATSIGRSGGSSSHSSSSVSRSSSTSSSHSTSSYSAPSKPAPSVAPAPSHNGGIGGTQSSVGVRKSEVTNGVKQDIAATRPAPASVGNTPSTSPQYAPAPHYSSPSPVVVNGGGGGFGTSFMGALGGTIVGNALFGNHGSSGTTVINNGPPSGGSVQSVPSAGSVADNQFNPGGVSSQSKKEYGVWSFIADVIGFVFLLAVLIGLAWVVYKGYQLVRNYVNKERGVSNIPFNPTQRFWEIQKAFAAADVNALQNLLGPDVVDELTNGLQPSTLTLHNVSHEVRLANTTEFSIWYKFEDDGAEVNQVWHYEKFGGGLWKLNGIENV